jgi:hypothetical protein
MANLGPLGWLALAAASLVPACSRPPAPAPFVPTAVHHDFGMIPHGRVVKQRLRIEFPTDRGPMLPLGYQGSCSCASTVFVIAGKDGRERFSHGQAQIEHCVLPGEELFLELTLDTSEKEALEQRPLTNAGRVLLTDLGDRVGRIEIPVVFTFGIDTPVRVVPFAHVDFGALPRSQKFSVTLELHGNAGRAVQFGPVEGPDDPRAHGALRREGDLTLLDVSFAPDDRLGPARCDLRIRTDLPDGYVLRIPVSGAVVDDISFATMDRISFGRFDFRVPKEAFLLLTDHDRRRAPGFVVQRIETRAGTDLAQHFSAALEAVEGDDRASRLVVRYLGSYRASRVFRGAVHLAKTEDGPKLAEIEFVGFDSEQVQ